ncbi:MAG: helix-turn-helix domain-containing protein, partial [Promethearchaeota archaeon]
WISEIFNKFQDLKIEILNFLPYDFENSIGNSIIEISHFKMDEIIDFIKNHPSVLDFSILEKEKYRIRLNVKTKDPYLLYAVIKCGVLIDFPVRVREGNVYWKLISSRKNIDELLEVFEEKNIKFDLLRIGNSPYDLEKDTFKLTYEESKILEMAIELGFFEIPRKISLEDLANRLGRSKSSLSVILRRIIRKKIMISS